MNALVHCETSTLRKCFATYIARGQLIVQV